MVKSVRRWVNHIKDTEQEYVFESLWDNSLGTADAAILDGSKWPNKHGCGSTVDMLSVIAPDTAGVLWTGPGNVLQVNTKGTRCASFDTVLDLADGESYRIGFARKVMPNIPESTITFHADAINPIGDIAAALWAYHLGNGSTYRVGFAFDTLETDPPTNPNKAINQWGPPINADQWYWFEFGVEILDYAAREMRIWPFTYTYPEGLLVADANDHEIDFGAGPDTLQTLYDEGSIGTWSITSPAQTTNWRRIGTGIEGPAVGGGTDNKWWTACYRVISGWDTPIGVPTEV